MTTTPPPPAPTYRLFVGVDIAAITAKVSWISPGEAATRAITIDQTPQGFTLLQQRLLSTGQPPEKILVVMEATGSYWMNLAMTLSQKGFGVSVINPAQAHHFARVSAQTGEDRCYRCANASTVSLALTTSTVDSTTTGVC